MARSLFFLLLLTLLAHISTTTAESSDNIVRHPILEKHTYLRFFWHLRFAEPDPTAVVIANSPINSPTGFGITTVFDNPITIGPSESSQLLGWSQGTYIAGDRKKVAIIMAMTFVFVEGKYNGSTFSVLGRNELAEEVRELPIVGGTGIFRLARGYCTLTTVEEDPVTHYGNVEYNCNIFHNSYGISNL